MSKPKASDAAQAAAVVARLQGSALSDADFQLLVDRARVRYDAVDTEIKTLEERIEALKAEKRRMYCALTLSGVDLGTNAHAKSKSKKWDLEEDEGPEF